MQNLCKGLSHLRCDPVLSIQIDKFGAINYPRPKDRFKNLVSTIIGQQLSNKAADTIYSRIMNITKIDPVSLLTVNPSQLRAAGTSWAKIKSIKDLSQKVLDKTLQLDKLDKMN